MKTHPIAALALLIASTGACAQPALSPVPPVIDGHFNDWDQVPITASDPIGDAAGFNGVLPTPFDISTVRARVIGTTIYLDFDGAEPANLVSGSFADGRPALVFEVVDGEKITIDFRTRTAFIGDNPTNIVTWPSIDFLSLPTYAATRWEARIDLRNYAVAGDTVRVDFGGTDSLDTPVELVLNDLTPGPTASRGFDRSPGTSLRVASLNTLRSGLLNTQQSRQIERMLQTVDADIYCFQEEWDTSASQMSTIITGFDPAGDGASWTAHRVNGCHIVARGEVIPAPAYNNRYAAAVVVEPNAEPLLVLSIHTKCCGHIGSDEDFQRIQQTTDMIRTINDVRSRKAGKELAPYADAPVVVIGDWNLVGSRTPLDMLTAPDLPGFDRVDFLDLSGTDAMTWRELDGRGFPSGTLDLAVYSADAIGVAGSFIFDTIRMPARALQESTAFRNDARASDHLMLVVDFTPIAEPADGGKTKPGSVDVQLKSIGGQEQKRLRSP